jgi:multiple sugar transport system substrate-binding protein
MCASMPPEPECGLPVRLWTRRRVVGLLTGAGMAGLLAACGSTTPTTGSTAAASTAAASSGRAAVSSALPATTAAATSKSAAPATAPAAGAAGVNVQAADLAAAEKLFQFPDSGAQLPTKPVTVQWIDSGGAKAPYFNALAPAYHAKHPNITVAYQPLSWNVIGNIVPLGVQNGNAPDVFQLPQNVPPGEAVAQGWLAPLEDIVPNFAAWQKAFPPNTFLPGIDIFNGKTYAMQTTSPKRTTLNLYNADYMQKAGYDPAAKAMTWSDFRAAAKKITEQGQGKYYGLIIGGSQASSWSGFVNDMGALAGAAGGEFNWKTGDYNYTSDQYLGVIDLLLALKSDGSMFPGSTSIDAPTARSRIAAGAAGMILQGVFNLPIWEQQNPDFHFGVASMPVPDSGTTLAVNYYPGDGEHYYVFAKTPNKAVVGDLFSYVGSEAGQVVWAKLVGGANPPVFPQAIKQIPDDPKLDQAFAIFDKQMHLGPSPLVRNPDEVQVTLERKTVTPDFGTTVQGIYTGQLTDPKKAMQDLKDRMNKELDRAIKAAQAKGAKVSRDDWVFPNWDPTKDYTPADYAALKKA